MICNVRISQCRFVEIRNQIALIYFRNKNFINYNTDYLLTYISIYYHTSTEKNNIKLIKQIDKK